MATISIPAGRRFVYLIMPVTLALLLIGCGGQPETGGGQTTAVAGATTLPSATPRPTATRQSVATPTVAAATATATPGTDATAVAATATAQVLEELDYFPAATATAPAPTPTATATTETADGVQVVSFTNEISEGNSSDDVLTELDYFIGGGGGGSSCGEERDAPYLSDYADDTVEIHVRTSSLDTCNWRLGEQVTVTVVDPDGREHREILTAGDPWETGSGRGEVSYTFQADVLRDPPGVYRIMWSGESGFVGHELWVTPAGGPRLYWNEDNSVILHNFRPQETVRVFAYVDEPIDAAEPALGNRARLHATATFQVDGNGQLVVEPAFDRPLTWIGALGEVSGAAEPDWRSSAAPTMRLVGTEIVWPVSDSGVEACRLPVVGLYGESYTVTMAERYVVRDSRGEEVGVLQPGQPVDVIGGTWWQEIEGQPGAYGWHWQIVEPESGELPIVWQELFAECSHLQ